MAQRQGQGKPDLIQQVASDEAEQGQGGSSQQAMGDAAMGKAVFQPTADRVADLADGAGCCIKVRELGAEDRQTQHHGICGAEDEAGSGSGNGGVGEGHHKQ